MSTNRRPETLVLVALSLWAAWAGCKGEPDTSTGSSAPTAGDKAKEANRAPKAEPTADASQPPSTPAPEVQRVAPTAWCFAHGFAPPALWKCKDSPRPVVQRLAKHDVVEG